LRPLKKAKKKNPGAKKGAPLKKKRITLGREIQWQSALRRGGRRSTKRNGDGDRGGDTMGVTWGRVRIHQTALPLKTEEKH